MKIKRIKIIILIAAIFLVIGITLNYIYTKTNNILAEIPYKYIGNISEDKVVVSNDKKFAYYNLKTKKLSKEYFLINQSLKQDNPDLSDYYYKDNYAKYTENKAMGIIDNNEKVIVEARYDNIDVVDKNIFITYTISGSQLINKSSELLLPNTYNEIVQIPNTSLLILKDNENEKIYNYKTKEMLLENIQNMDYLFTEDNDILIINCDKENTKKNYIYKVKSNSLDYINDLDNLYPTKSNHNYIVFGNDYNYNTIYNIETNEIIKLTGDYIGVDPISSGLAKVVNDDNKAGFINKSEELVIPFKYDANNTTSFTKDNIAVACTKLCGIINNENKTIIDYKYNDISIINNNIFVVTQNINQKLINIKNETLTKKKYNSIIKSTNNNYLITEITTKNKTKYGLIDLAGNELVKCIYDDIVIYNDNVLLKVNNKYIVKGL